MLVNKDNFSFGFFVYFLLARFGTRKYICWKLPVLTFVRIIGSGLAMFAVLSLLKRFVPYNKATMLLLVALGAVVYGAVLLVSGEIKGEVKAVMSKIKK